MPTAEEIAAAALNPKSVTSDGTNVEARSIKELIEAAEHIANEESRQSAAFPIRIFSTRPPGAV